MNASQHQRMTWAGVAAVVTGALVALPAVAQLNPNPSIFNEAPFNRGGSTPASLEMTEEAETEAPTIAASGSTIVDIAVASDVFGTLVAALTGAELAEVLQGEGPFTVFAPTDEAFANLPPGTIESLLRPENRETLVQILTYHVVPGSVTSSDLSSGDVATVEGRPVTIMVEEGRVMVNNANVIEADIMASNGVIHVIDSVILPPDL